MTDLPVKTQGYSLGTAKKGLNLGGVRYYGCTPFINILRSAFPTWNYPQYTDANGWLANLPVGVLQQLILYSYTAAYQYQLIPPGQYTVKWLGPMSIGITGSIVSNLSGVTQNGAYYYRTFDLALPTKASTFNITAQNTASGLLSCNDIQVFKTTNSLGHSQEAQLLAGELFSEEFLNSLSYVQSLRFMDWGGTNNSTVLRPADLPTEDWMNWQTVPYTVMAKLAQKLDLQSMHINVPYGCRPKAFTVDLANNLLRMPNHGYAHNTKVVFIYGTLPAPCLPRTIYYVVNETKDTLQLATSPDGALVNLTSTGQSASKLTEYLSDTDLTALYSQIFASIGAYYTAGLVNVAYSNENWNAIFSHFGALRDCRSIGLARYSTRGAVITNSKGGENPGDVLYELGCLSAAWAQGNLLAWKAAENALGSDRVIRTHESHAANYDAWNGALQYIDPGIIKPGVRVGNLAAYAAIAPYLVSSSDGITKYPDKRLKAEKAYNNDDSFWLNCATYGTAICKSYTSKWLGGLAVDFPALKLTTYECGIDWETSMQPNYAFIFDSTSSEMIVSEDISTLFDDADQAWFFAAGGSAPWAGANTGSRPSVKKTGQNTLQLFSSQANFDAGMPLTLAVSSAYIVGVTQASPGVITTDGPHGLSAGDTVMPLQILGMTQLNGNTYTVDTVLSANTLTLRSGSTPLDTRGFSAYVGMGRIGRKFQMDNATRTDALADKYKSLRLSPLGADIFSNNYAAMKNSVATYNNFVDSGGWSVGTQPFCWGMRPTHFHPENTMTMRYRAIVV